VAINKSQSPMWVKVVLIVLIVAFVSLFVGSGIGGLFSQSSNQAGQQTPVDQAQQINAQYQPQVDSLSAVVASQPESFTALVNLGNTYMDWGGALLQASQNATAPAMQFLGARNAYEKALTIKKDDPALLGDFAVVLFYTGDTTGAITAANDAVALKPDFSVVWFNLGNFYLEQARASTAGAKAKAIEAYNKYLALEPSGDRADAAKANIAEAQKLP
jgi:tetratricopeptide (TPR) repeat protein